MISIFHGSFFSFYYFKFILQSSVENNLSDFTKFDNIPMRLNQIEQYKNKLNGIPNIPKRSKTTKESTTETQPKKKFKVILRNHSLS